ncbi:hypothetical protein G5C60_28615 [Streptomyces sp. HC44]|uniref:Uncharacterized protein n=1 Tax=Streptomyces scabichelini TaxID=2711217 RepID=A0A6G4VCA1_9ACTN|nr:hypothetical protein [Streptomyces scabichelini]NGO11460.1 hypothetical protein [Streptomyces scabichelini]
MNPFERLLHALDGAGLWRDVSTDKTRALIRRLMSGQDAAWASGGAWRADGEDLADGDVEVWLRGMAAPLNDCGVDLTVATDSGPFDEGLARYTVTVNGTALNLYTVDPADPRVPLTDDPWMDCTVEPAAEVNRLLHAAGSDRRIALFWPGGNDGFSVLGPESVLHQAAAATSAVDGASAFIVP